MGDSLCQRRRQESPWYMGLYGWQN